MGIPVTTYTMHEASVTHLPAKRAEMYARVFDTTPEWLLYGRDPRSPPTGVPLLTEDGENVFGMTVRTPEAGAMTRALMVEDFSPELDGWMAYFEYPQGGMTPDLLGLLCVVAVKFEGLPRLWVRKPIAAETADHHHLTEGAFPLFDQIILWAARIDYFGRG